MTPTDGVPKRFLRDEAPPLRPCPDCGAEVGQPHEGGCDVAVCLWTGGQRLQCSGSLAKECCLVLIAAGRPDLAEDLGYHLNLDDPAHDRSHEVWTGLWPGSAECAEFGWWCYWGPDWGERGWVRCHRDHPGATADLNRLVPECKWDRSLARWVQRKTGDGS